MQDNELILSEDNNASIPDANQEASFSETTSNTDTAPDAEAASGSGASDSSLIYPNSFFTVSAGDAHSVTGQAGDSEALVLVDYSTQLEVLIASNQRMEMQLEACISILMIFVVVGLLNYIYKFFKIFF